MSRQRALDQNGGMAHRWDGQRWGWLAGAANSPSMMEQRDAEDGGFVHSQNRVGGREDVGVAATGTAFFADTPAARPKTGTKRNGGGDKEGVVEDRQAGTGVREWAASGHGGYQMWEIGVEGRGEVKRRQVSRGGGARLFFGLVVQSLRCVDLSGGGAEGLGVHGVGGTLI